MQRLETRRLTLRPMAWEDWQAIAEILQDAKAMYAYEHPFSRQEVDQWLHNQITRYEREGVGLWAAVERESGRLVGQAGITWQDWEGRRVPEIGNLFNRAYWHQGYATEAAAAWKEYGFTTLSLPALYSIIRENNDPSRRVAQRNGMTVVGRLIKHYYGMDMPHEVYCITREEYERSIGDEA